MVDPYAALRTPCRGQKPRLFATPFCNSITLWLTTLRKYPVKEGTGYSWRILFPDGWQKLIAGVSGIKVPECWPVNYHGKLYTNLDQKKFLVIFWLWAALRLQVLCSSFMIFHSSHYHPNNTRLLTEKLNAGVGGPTKPKVDLFCYYEKS